MRLKLLFIILLPAAPLTGASGQGVGLPITSADGREFGVTYRVDGSRPSREQAERDKRDCLSNPSEVGSNDVARLQRLARSDRDAAEREIAKAVIPCMAKKGWRIVLH